jgi:hypothetical protein
MPPEANWPDAAPSDHHQLIGFVVARFPEYAAPAILALCGSDPDQSPDWWARRIRRLMRLEQDLREREI